MKQVVQNYHTGELTVEDVPAPRARAGSVLVRTAYSLVSVGTERMKVEQARMSLLQKARARPDKVRQVLQSVRQVGLTETYRKVMERLDALTPLGYSLAGVVEEVGAGIDEFTAGARVACAGEAIACHAEFVCVPRNLCARVPDGVELRDAAFTTVGAIALNGVRQAGVTVGDSVLVVGLGLVGLLAVQILKAAGCRVIGVDLDPAKVELARACGADVAALRSDAALEDTIRHATGGAGPDAAYIAASTPSTDPMELSGRVLRDRGRVVIVGMVKVEADWRVYYQKELSVVMARSYGPGRYDANYEQRGIDYPIGYVRWTQRRNLEEFLRLVGTGQVRPNVLSPATFPLERAPEAYRQLKESPGKHAVGILFEYPSDARREPRVAVHARSAGGAGVSGAIGVGVIGAGNFTTGTLIPAIKRVAGIELRAICSAGGLTAKSAARRHGFEFADSGFDEVLADPRIHAVVIATRHDTHAPFAAAALRAGKHVFVEKPLALTRPQLADVLAAAEVSGRIVMPGYNRRFSPLALAVREYFTGRASPVEVVARVNAGRLASDSWYLDDQQGGWRIVSEGCHWVDLIQSICGSQPVRVFADMVGGDVAGEQRDNCAVQLRMADGSLGTLVYVANGDPLFEKERIEVFGQGRTAVIDNWRSARLSAGGKSRTLRGSGKGHAEEMQAFFDAVRRGGPAPIPLGDAVACTLATLAAQESAVAGRALRVGWDDPGPQPPSVDDDADTEIGPRTDAAVPEPQSGPAAEQATQWAP